MHLARALPPKKEECLLVCVTRKVFYYLFPRQVFCSYQIRIHPKIFLSINLSVTVSFQPKKSTNQGTKIVLICLRVVLSRLHQLQ